MNRTELIDGILEVGAYSVSVLNALSDATLKVIFNQLYL